MQGKLWVDVGLWGGITPVNAGNESVLLGMLQAGVLGFKSFMSPSGIPPWHQLFSCCKICTASHPQLFVYVTFCESYVSSPASVSKCHQGIAMLHATAQFIQLANVDPASLLSIMLRASSQLNGLLGVLLQSNTPAA